LRHGANLQGIPADGAADGFVDKFTLSAETAFDNAGAGASVMRRQNVRQILDNPSGSTYGLSMMGFFLSEGQPHDD
jgi:hypothetical protein